MNSYHIPVLLKETIAFLQVKKGGRYIDCTLGGGGHTRAILEAGGLVLAIDKDPEAINHALQHPNLTLKHGNFENLKDFGWENVDGILMDLGVSSHQLETDYRGFSFNQDAKLDMRMNPQNQKITALDLINAGSEKELANIFREFGEERFANAIAREIKKTKIETTNQLAEAVLRARPAASRRGWDRTHPATRIFQALRIAVNDELNSLKITLPQAVELLAAGGRLAVISFHSLEDRIIKNFIRSDKNLKIITPKPVTPTNEEIAVNPRARSGKLRVAEKL